MVKKINIKDAKPYVLDDNNLAYKLENGSANVYISEFVDGRPTLRLFLKELNVGDKVSGLSKKFDGVEYKIFVVNSARDNNEEVKQISLSCSKTSSKIKNDFLNGVDLLITEKDYAANLIQHYQINEVKGSRNIYSDYLSNYNAEKDTLINIASSINKSDDVEVVDSNANDLYYSLATVAKANKIKYVAFDELNTDQKSSLTPQVFAEYSSCICKRISLDNDWYLHDVGNFVTTIDDKNDYVACIFRNNKYYYISKDKPYFTKIDKNNAPMFNHYAYCLYRILPERELKINDVFKFIYNSISFKYVVAILLMGLLVSIIGMISPVVNQFIYDVLIPNKDFWGLFGCACILISMIFGSGSVALVKAYASLSVSSKIKYTLQIALFDRVFKLRQSFIKKFEPADLSMRILGVGNIFTALTTQTVASIVGFVFSFLYLYQMFLFMPGLCAPAIFITLIMLVLLLVFSKIQYKWYLEASLIGIEKSSLLYQLIRGIAKLRTSGAENRAINKYMEKHIASSKLNYKSNFYSTMVGILGALISSIAMVIFYLGVYSDGLVASVGSFMGFVTAYGIFSSSVMQIPTCYLSYLQAKPWIDRLKPVMNEVPEKSVLSQTMDEISGEIDVRHITFAYEKDSPIVLDDLSFSVKQGEYIGIAGASGCGKSTLFNLLLGFEHQDKGKIYYDHHDLDELNKKELRQNFGVVLQDGDIVSGSIYDNIAIAKPDATYEEVMDVLDEVGMTDEVNLMPMGVFTMLSEGSGLISGGQKQRILIARALINKPKVLFMDEATSALDNIVQAKISNYLKTIDCTKIVIAHRLSTIINCDKILVLDEGKIAESGTYDELMKAKGIFYNLAKRQLS